MLIIFLVFSTVLLTYEFHVIHERHTSNETLHLRSLMSLFVLSFIFFKEEEELNTEFKFTCKIYTVNPFNRIVMDLYIHIQLKTLCSIVPIPYDVQHMPYKWHFEMNGKITINYRNIL